MDLREDIREQASQERARLERSRRATPIIWAAVVVLTGAGLTKVYYAMRMAEAYDISLSGVWLLVSMRNAQRLQRAFAGYEVIVLDYVMAAGVELTAAAIMALVMVLRQSPARRMLDIVTHVARAGVSEMHATRLPKPHPEKDDD